MKPTPPEIIQIAKLCLEYEEACTALEGDVATIEAQLREVKDRHTPRLKRAAGKIAAAEAALEAAIQQHPELFVSPRTLTLHGVRVGYHAAAGKLEIDDVPAAIQALRRILGREEAEGYIATKEDLLKDPLRKLDPKILERMGCRIVDAGDQVVIRRPAGEIEKMMNKLVTRLVEAVTTPDTN